AGNTRGVHGADLCLRPADSILADPRLFYPACLTNGNITSVTQLGNKPDSACRYQNYSDKLITLGVLNPVECCLFSVVLKTTPKPYEGSSFATPAASGMRMRTILLNPTSSLADSDWETNLKHTNTSKKI